MDARSPRGFQLRTGSAYSSSMARQAPLLAPHVSIAAGALALVLAGGLWAWAAAIPRAADRAWIDESSAAFETRLRTCDPSAWSPEFELALWAALPGPPREATRAALLLARDPRASTTDGLLEFLESRQPYAGRPDDAGACTAAASLAARDLNPGQVERLEQLASQAPHPDLEVRTECAIAAFTHGRRSAGRFLVRVLRIDTPSESVEGPLTDSATTAWARGRAATCLCDALGLPRENWTDASLTERERRADQLSRLLGEPDPCLTR
jgi:hypothetical protein